MCGVQLDQARVTAFTDVGFKPPGLYAARLNLPAIAKTEDEQRLFVRTVQENLAQAPGVASVSVGDGVPLDFIYRNARVARDGESTFVAAHTTRVGAGYLETHRHPPARRSRDRRERSRRRGTSRRVVRAARTTAVPDQQSARRACRLCLGRGRARRPTPWWASRPIWCRRRWAIRGRNSFSRSHSIQRRRVLVIARGAPSDPSMRGAFENAIAGGLRMISGPAEILMSCSASSSPANG